MRCWLLFLGVLLVACVERKLHIRTEPPGAHVRVNGRDVGVSPVVWTFTHYGTVRVTVRLDGHVPEERTIELVMPWYQYPVADFFADLVVPVTIHDDHQVSIALEPQPERTGEEIEALAEETARRAAALRDEMRRLEAEDE